MQPALISNYMRSKWHAEELFGCLRLSFEDVFAVVWVGRE